MSAPAEPTKTPGDSGAESPTTARPLDLDDDDVQESGVMSPEGAVIPPVATESTPAGATDAGPPKPPRPMSEAQKNELTLKEAFPAVETGVIRAVLTASGGRVEPAFHALLEMTDPDAVKNEPEVAPPPQPPRPQGQQGMSQVEADELYARQLAERYDNAGAYEARTSNRGGGGRPGPRQGWNEDDREHSFIDDDLPVIRDNLRKGFQETQTTVSGWISTLRKRIEDGFDESDEQPKQGQQYGRPTEPGRRSGDYDADPQVLSDDFAGMRFSADGTPGNRPPGQYKTAPPNSASPRPSDGRRVGFKEETEEIDMYDSSPKVPPKDAPPASAASKASKWQPLSSVDPNPIADNDPFSLGDSDDEKEAKDKDKPKEVSADENERLKKAAAEAMAESLVDEAKKESLAARKA